MKNPYEKFYSKGYKDESAIRKHTQEVDILRNILKEIPFSPDNKVLDVACGVSTLGKTFGNDVYGFDLNPQAVKVAKMMSIKARLGDVEKKWKYPTEYFDIVIASHIIEHLVNPDHLILEAKRVLKKSGILIILTPNLAAWFNRILLLFGIQPFLTEVSTVDKTLGLRFTRRLTPGRSPVGHLRLFTPGSLRDILELHGFKIHKMTGMEFGSFSPMLGTVDRLISHITPLAACIITIGRKN